MMERKGEKTFDERVAEELLQRRIREFSDRYSVSLTVAEKIVNPPVPKVDVAVLKSEMGNTQ